MPSGKTALSIVRQFYPDVTRVDDATKDVFLSVTRKHTRSARVLDHNECALAVACKDQLNADGAIISTSTAYVIKGKKAIRFEVPTSVAREIVSFDRKAGFSEGEYELHRPCGSRQLGVRKHGEGGAGGQKNGGMKKRFAHYTDNIRLSLKNRQ